VATVLAKASRDAALAEREAAAFTPPPLNAATALAPPVVTVIGDGVTVRVGTGPGPKTEWPALLATALGAKVSRLAADGAGYVGGGSHGTFATLAARVPPSSKVIVFFGGARDRDVSSLALVTAATRAFAAARTVAPNAALVVIGPTSAAGTAPQSLITVRDTLKSAADVAGATWVDPISGGWLSAGLADSSGAPTKQGQQAIERKLAAVLEPKL
jgi:hypothetical protein